MTVLSHGSARDVQGARNFFGFFLNCHYLALLFPSKMSYWTGTGDVERYGHIKFWHLSEQPYEHSNWLFGAYHFAFENLSWKFVLAGFDGLWTRIYSQKINISISKMADSKWRIRIYEINKFETKDREGNTMWQNFFYNDRKRSILPYAGINEGIGRYRYYRT